MLGMAPFDTFVVIRLQFVDGGRFVAPEIQLILFGGSYGSRSRFGLKKKFYINRMYNPPPLPLKPSSQVNCIKSTPKRGSSTNYNRITKNKTIDKRRKSE